MIILNLDPWNYSDKAKCIFSELGEYKELQNISRDALKEEINVVNILVLRLSHHLDKELLSYAKELKYIVTNCTGLDHIDVDCCKQLGIEVISLKGEFNFLRDIHATAELTWGLLLDSYRHISKAQWHVSERNGWKRDLFFGNELHGKKIGILGLGRIGEKIADFANCFGMSVKAYDPNPLSHARYIELFDNIEALFSSDIDILSVHVNYYKATHYLINARLLKKLKPGVTIVNTSRGAIVDEVALIEELKSQRIKCYATDVVENENEDGFLNTSALLNAKNNGANILITPHIGGVTYESWHKTEEFCAFKLKKAIEMRNTKC